MTDKLTFPHIHDATVAFIDNPSKSKARPVLVIKLTDGLVSVMQITSQEPKEGFQTDTRYEILDWNKCGLKKPSWIKFFPQDIRKLPKDTITTYRGKLTDRDIQGLTSKMKNNRFK